MNKKIVQRMEEIKAEIEKDPNGTGRDLADLLQLLAFQAIHGGRNNKPWRQYMRYFASNPDQLTRLCGEDNFVNETWGRQALAYMVANSTCGIATYTDTKRNMNPEMLNDIDKGLNDEVALIPPDA